MKIDNKKIGYWISLAIAYCMFIIRAGIIALGIACTGYLVNDKVLGIETTSLFSAALTGGSIAIIIYWIENCCTKFCKKMIGVMGE